MNPIFAVVFLLSLLLFGGCQSQLMLMPTPEVLKDDRFNLFEANPDPMTSNEIATLYVTTRVPDERRNDFFKGLSASLRSTVHVYVPYKDGDHHALEAVFKAFGKALRQATRLTGGAAVLSTKGRLDD